MKVYLLIQREITFDGAVTEDAILGVYSSYDALVTASAGGEENVMFVEVEVYAPADLYLGDKAEWF